MMKPSLVSVNSSSSVTSNPKWKHGFCSFERMIQNPHSVPSNSSLVKFPIPTSFNLCVNNNSSRKWQWRSRLVTVFSRKSSASGGSSDLKKMMEEEGDGFFLEDGSESQNLTVQVGNPNLPMNLPSAKLSLNDQVFFLLTFIACTTSLAFTSLVIAAVPTLYSMGRAAISLSKLADTAREELPSTMAAIRLSGMEISDLTLELSDLSQEITEGVHKSAQAVQAAEAGIRQIGSIAKQQTISMIQERANLPVISIQPVVAGAAKKTSRAVGQATKTLMNIISRGELSSDDDNGIDRLEL